MELTLSVYSSGSGWDCPPDASLDSPNTLVVAFGAPALGRWDRFRPECRVARSGGNVLCELDNRGIRPATLSEESPDA